MQGIWDLFELVSGQWNVGPGGPMGLNYMPVMRILDLADMGARDQLDIIEHLKVLEAEFRRGIKEEHERLQNERSQGRHQR